MSEPDPPEALPSGTLASDTTSAREARLEALEGTACTLESLWSDGPCLLVFLRHFACPSCSVRVDGWTARVALLERLGVRFAIIGCGSREAVKAHTWQARAETILAG